MHNANEHQVGGTHYATGGAVQHWDYVQQALDGAYLMGNVTKYVARHRKKNGLQDLEKAKHYLLKIYELHEAGAMLAARLPGSIGKMSNVVTEFIHSSELNYLEGRVMIEACLWSNSLDLAVIRGLIAQIEGAYKAQSELDTASGATEAGAGYVDQARDEPATLDEAERFARWLSVQSPAIAVGSGAETPVLIDALDRYRKFCEMTAARSS